MSTKNHPNFHAVLFVTKLATAYREAIRGPALKLDDPWDEALNKLIIDFVDAVDEHVDAMVREQLATREHQSAGSSPNLAPSGLPYSLPQVTAYLVFAYPAHDRICADAHPAMVGIYSEPGYKLNLVAGSDVVGPYRYENTDIQHSAGSYADAKRLLCHDIENEADMWRGSLRRALEALARTGENVLVADHERT